MSSALDPHWEDFGDFDRGFRDPFDAIPRIHFGYSGADRTLCGIGSLTSEERGDVTCKRCMALMTKGVMGVTTDE